MFDDDDNFWLFCFVAVSVTKGDGVFRCFFERFFFGIWEELMLVSSTIQDDIQRLCSVRFQQGLPPLRVQYHSTRATTEAVILGDCRAQVRGEQKLRAVLQMLEVEKRGLQAQRWG